MKRFSPRCKWPVNAAADPRHGMSTLAFVLGSLLWCAVLGALWFVIMKEPPPNEPASESPSSASEEESDEGKPKSLVIRFPSKPLPDFEFDECMGGKVSRDSLRGQRWLAVFVFTRCVETCPMITRHVAELHKKVAESNPDFRFITFSVDSSYDTAEVLKKYAETFNADHDRWKFLTGEEQTIHNLIRTGFTQYVAPNLGEKRKPGYEVAHTNRAVLVNEDGIPVATYLMTDPEDVVRLRRVIEGKSEFPEPVDGDSPVVGADGNPAIQFTPVPAEQESIEPTRPSDEASSTEDTVPEKADAASTSDNPANASLHESSKSGKSPAGESAEARNERIEQALPGWVASLPTVNASLNSLCTLLLIAGFAAIRGGKRSMHRNLMVTAFGVSVIFLACYVTYHEALHRFTGERGRAFIGSELAKIVYFAILVPHVILAVFVPILALRVFWLSWKERWPEHRRLARITLPIWLFVSITGVVIYAMLYHWPWQNLQSTAVAFA